MSLFDPQPEFIEHDAFVHALLGLTVLNKKLEALMHTAPGIGSGAQNTGNLIAISEQKDDGILLALLGLISVSDKLQSVLDEWTREFTSDSHGSFSGEFGFEKIEDLLR